MILRINIQNRQLPAENESVPRDYLSLGWSRGFLLRGKLYVKPQEYGRNTAV